MIPQRPTQLYRFVNAALLACLACIHLGCKSLGGGDDELRNEIFALETRLNQMQTKLNTSGSEQQNISERLGQVIAGIDSKIQNIQKNIRKQSGEIDLLHNVLGRRHTTTYLQNHNEGIVADMQVLEQDIFALKNSLEQWSTTLSENIQNNFKETLQNLNATVENMQKSIQDLQQKLTSAQKKAPTKLASLKQAREAFQKKQYLKLSRDIPGLIPKMTRQTSVEELSYYYAESLLSLGEVEKASLAYRDYIATNPKAEYKRKAKLRLGDAFRYRGDKETAVIYYDEVIEEFPNTKEAELASERRTKLLKP